MTSIANGAVSSSGERASTLTARAIADLVGGELVGDEATLIGSVAPLSRARHDQLSFLADARYADDLTASSAGVILVTPALAGSPGPVPSRVIVAKPQTALITLLPRLYTLAKHVAGVHPSVVIGRGAHIGANVCLEAHSVIGRAAEVGDGVWIGANAVVGDGVRIGAGSRLHPHVTLYAGTAIGERVVLHSGVRIGSDGFGYVFTDGIHAKIPHVGGCIIENDVEIGANTTIDRGSIDDTVIGAGTKIDNLVQVGHNVRIGRLCLIMAQVGIAGSTSIGDGCVIAGQAGLAGHINIGDGAKIAGQSGVFGDVPEGESWSGYPARRHRESLRATGALFKLSGMVGDLQRLVEERPAT
ncbi:MAG: UDP-3-O-(3-hydroxymyristoyl)glucosamine N-acyltransferase [Gemmatimonadaceae bacterium]